MPPAGEPRAAARGTILLVEYNNTLRHLIWAALKKEGYAVLEARGAEEALRLHGTHPGGINLLLAEDRPEEMTGLELAARLREKNSGLQLLLMTGDPAGSGVAAPAAGDHPIAKPFTLDDLLGRVKALLRAP